MTLPSSKEGMQGLSTHMLNDDYSIKIRIHTHIPSHISPFHKLRRFSPMPTQALLYFS